MIKRALGRKLECAAYFVMILQKQRAGKNAQLLPSLLICESGRGRERCPSSREEADGATCAATFARRLMIICRDHAATTGECSSSAHHDCHGILDNLRARLFIDCYHRWICYGGQYYSALLARRKRRRMSSMPRAHATAYVRRRWRNRLRLRNSISCSRTRSSSCHQRMRRVSRHAKPD